MRDAVHLLATLLLMSGTVGCFLLLANLLNFTDTAWRLAPLPAPAVLDLSPQFSADQHEIPFYIVQR